MSKIQEMMKAKGTMEEFVSGTARRLGGFSRPGLPIGIARRECTVPRNLCIRPPGANFTVQCAAAETLCLRFARQPT